MGSPRMKTQSPCLSHAGRWLLNRRDFLRFGGTGLGSIALTQPLWDFKPRGQSAKMISEMLPHLAELADEMCFIHSMTANSNTHGPAENQMSTGFTLDGFPSMGAWVSYALGTVNQDLPAFVAIPDPRGVPQIGPNHWNSAFLPAAFQGAAFNADKPIPNLKTPPEISAKGETASRDFLSFLNDRHLI